ncbi:preprotein translocase subunit SecD [Thermococcus litoralis DSM 5473]|uniref:Protein-export membrane protein SecD n=1 Tax=Thermococcus litoralis (strain ATCC 51850 / DSM 5473 / JCM 8560 / NS-C) TaxID=523849 RepID=H3ZKG1_THELN|nr:preprotein translocase subunit SecD [Thermococcus litoralis]EHR79563.1 preprotein translocase subunit SecD [Thermococcus litoralis DSM 5473]
MNLKKLLLNGRVLLLILVIVGSILTIIAQGITYGLDISGGVEITVQLEKPVDQSTMEEVRISLENRLNTLGVKDITLEPWGDQIIKIRVANVTEEEANSIIDTINRQGVFYAEFNGVIFATGADIKRVDQVSYEPREGAWIVPFSISKEAAEKFAQLALGKVSYPVDIFLDPPVNSTLIVSQEIYTLMNSNEFQFVPDAKPLPQRLKEAFNIDVVPYTNQSVEEIAKLAQGKEKVILVGVNGELESTLKNLGIKVEKREPRAGEAADEFIRRILGLYGPYRLQEGLTTGEPHTELAISIGGSKEDIAAMGQAQVVSVVLRSGSLPVKVFVEGVNYIPPTLGEQFRKQVVQAGIVALLVVGLIVYLHYRKARIAIPVVLTSLSEVIAILGVAALIRWNLDLPSIAGIIAAIGTGVDQQIVITDELLGGRKKEKITKRSGILKRMGRAFFVIWASATTTIVAMSFLFKFFVGGLRGFAFTTILGVLIGILITRPAYAEIAKVLLSEER